MKLKLLNTLSLRSSSSSNVITGSFKVDCCSVAKLCRLFVIPWTVARQASPSFINSQSLLKLMSIKLVMPSNHLILCHPLLLLPSIFPSISLSQWVGSLGRQMTRVRCKGDCRRMVTELQHCWLSRWEKGLWTKKGAWPLEAGKCKGTFSIRDSRREHSSARTLLSAQGDLC